MPMMHLVLVLVLLLVLVLVLGERTVLASEVASVDRQGRSFPFAAQYLAATDPALVSLGLVATVVSAASVTVDTVRSTTSTRHRDQSRRNMPQAAKAARRRQM